MFWKQTTATFRNAKALYDTKLHVCKTLFSSSQLNRSSGRSISCNPFLLFSPVLSALPNNNNRVMSLLCCSSLPGYGGGKLGCKSTRSPSNAFSAKCDGMNRPTSSPLPLMQHRAAPAERPAGQRCAQMRNETPPTQWRTSRSAWWSLSCTDWVGPVSARQRVHCARNISLGCGWGEEEKREEGSLQDQNRPNVTGMMLASLNNIKMK